MKTWLRRSKILLLSKFIFTLSKVLFELNIFWFWLWHSIYVTHIVIVIVVTRRHVFLLLSSLRVCTVKWKARFCLCACANLLGKMMCLCKCIIFFYAKNYSALKHKVQDTLSNISRYFNNFSKMYVWLIYNKLYSPILNFWLKIYLCGSIYLWLKINPRMWFFYYISDKSCTLVFLQFTYFSCFHMSYGILLLFYRWILLK